MATITSLTEGLIITLKRRAEWRTHPVKSAVTLLKYGNTNTFLIRGAAANLLVDTDYAGTLQAFYRQLKENGIRLSDISFVMATHYHPDHCGLIGQLQHQGVRLLLMDSQADAVHFPDYIFAREKKDYIPVDPEKATILSFAESRPFLKELGIDGEMVHTLSHSEDGVALILDDGNCFVGDLEPCEYIDAYGKGRLLAKDWDLIMSRNPGIIHYAHAPARPVEKQ